MNWVNSRSAFGHDNSIINIVMTIIITIIIKKFFDPSTQFPGNEKNYAMQYKKSTKIKLE